MDIGHLKHPVYGAPELAEALCDNPAEYLPIFEQAAKLERQRILSLQEDGGEAETKDVQVVLAGSGALGTPWRHWLPSLGDRPPRTGWQGACRCGCWEGGTALTAVAFNPIPCR